jgi:hypothetical protein
MEELDKFRPVIFHVGDGLAEAGIAVLGTDPMPLT